MRNLCGYVQLCYHQLGEQGMRLCCGLCYNREPGREGGKSGGDKEKEEKKGEQQKVVGGEVSLWEILCQVHLKSLRLSLPTLRKQPNLLHVH